MRLRDAHDPIVNALGFILKHFELLTEQLARDQQVFVITASKLAERQSRGVFEPGELLSIIFDYGVEEDQ